MTNQRDLLAELNDHNMVSPWTPSPRTVFQTDEDKSEQNDMHECCMYIPFALHLADRNTGNRVWFKVYDDAEELVQKILDFAITTNPDFYQFALDAYVYWVRNGRDTLWNPESFLQQISQRTYFIWSCTPNYDLNNEEAWTPCADQWADIHLQEILHPSHDLASSAHPEFAIRPSIADQFAHLNNISLLTEILNPTAFLANIRKTRFLTLSEPAVTFTQAVCEQMIPCLARSREMPIPDRMVEWVQDVDAMVIEELSQGRRSADDALFGSMAVRNLGAAVIDDEQFARGVGVYVNAYMSDVL
jgi:hypothetical protein